MKTLLLILFACLLLFNVTGCDNNKTLNPVSVQTEHTFVVSQLPMEERVCYDGEIRMVRVLYTANGTYILDYPVGFIGPIPDGHMRMDGTQAPSGYKLLKGDPTADDAQGDGDGTVVSK